MKFQLESTDIVKLPYQKGLTPLYNPKMCDVVISVAEAGGQEAQMCINCGICMGTFKKYQKEYPEFGAAVEYAKLIFVARLEAMMVAGAQGDIEKYNFKANEKLLAVAEEKYRTLAERNQNNTTINFNTLNLTPEQLEQQIKDKLENLRLLNADFTSLPISAPIVIDQEGIDE